MVANALQKEVNTMENIDTETGEITPAVLPIRNANPLTRVRVAKQFNLPSLAKQSFKEECNINTIMRKYEKSGLIDHLNTHQGEYGNFIGFENYHTSLNQILEANEAFSTIPAKIRYQFNNDPEAFLQFAQNPENLDQMIEMGLAPPKPPEPATGAPAASAEPPPPGTSGGLCGSRRNGRRGVKNRETHPIGGVLHSYDY